MQLTRTRSVWWYHILSHSSCPQQRLGTIGSDVAVVLFVGGVGHFCSRRLQGKTVNEDSVCYAAFLSH